MTSSFREMEKFTKRSVRSSERLSEKDIRLLSRKKKRAEKRSYEELEGIAVLGGEYD